MRILVIDTCLGACQVALFDAGRLVVGASEAMERGHQERLGPMAAEVMAGVAFAAIDKLAVTIGPGSFTGLRVGLAFAKGLRLATGKPLAAIGTLAALAASAGGEGLSAGVIDARRGQVYLQPFDGDHALAEPDVMALSEAARRLQGLAPNGWRLLGPGAALLGETLAAEVRQIAAPTLAALGRLAAGIPSSIEVKPLYLRAPDARPVAT